MEVEKYLEEQDLPYTVFQPQYIYGPYTNKDCEQWFVDRIIRFRGPVPPHCSACCSLSQSHGYGHDQWNAACTWTGAAHVVQNPICP